MEDKCMKEFFLSLLRNKTTDRKAFREAAYNIGLLVAQEVMQALPSESCTITTPLEETQGIHFVNSIVLIPILRSGSALLAPFLHFFPQAKIGFLGLRRDEITAQPMLYYTNIPAFTTTDIAVILDPMIATGGSACKALEIIYSSNNIPSRILFAALLAAPEGIAALKKSFPAVRIIGPLIDRGLNDKKYIVPGLGDFGDRYFGTD